MATANQTQMPEDDKRPRSVTSAVPGMTVASVRRALSSIRQDWKSHQWDRPFDSATRLPNGRSYEAFAYAFLLGHHVKRHRKSKRQGV